MEEARKQRRMRSLERYRFIVDYLKSHKSVDVFFLSSELDVSEVTIRKDLEKLERENFLVRTHGGAILNEHLFLEPSFLEKEDRFKDEKAGIAFEAAKLIQNEMVIALATGTTVSHITRFIKDRNALTVVTNAINAAIDLMGIDGIQVFMTGGSIRPNTFALIGETAEKSLDGIYTDYVFFGTNGFRIDEGVTTPSMEEARVVRKLIENAKHVVMLADHSKFGNVAFYRIVPTDQIHTVITDRKAPAEDLEKLREKGIQIIIA
jgi:DeoR/GlpR family transcriptional regulator of sugar metabolism